MRDHLVKLSVPLCEEFKARVQHVDMFACRICVFPLIASKYRTELYKAFSELVGVDETPERPVSVTSSNVAASFIAIMFLLSSHVWTSVENVLSAVH